MHALANYLGWDSGVEQFIEKKLLRRTMEQEAKNNPRLQLPMLKSELVRLAFHGGSVQEEMYKRMEKEYASKLTQSETLEGILRCRQVCSHPAVYMPRKRKFVLDDGCLDQDSVKFKYICDDIQQHNKEKCLVFCLWTREIELLVNYMNQRGICALRYDGGMTRERRENVLYNFTNSPGVRALIIQISAGGVGLNLQAATRVYIMNPTWNPCAELQAIARAHRLGQDQIVTCVRLVIEDTVEERMLNVQDGKLEMIADCFDDDSLFTKMGVGDMKQLLQPRKDM
jgi:SNF2 family DNA or RNA helicase